ncbi:MAG: hypothetical protein UY75_C0019G0005 [Parcubacteria group bacterium GW2011_GWC2_52_8c]|nr:MAG: hypothetical protein UY75_C0019G0005 [Parcubacteria group bacterium GW2011_GWC2_52_8c]
MSNEDQSEGKNGQIGPAEEGLRVPDLQKTLAEVGELDSRLRELEEKLDVRKSELPEGHPDLEELESEVDRLRRDLSDKNRLLRSIQEEGPNRQHISGK